MANFPKYFYFRVHVNMTSVEIEDASDVDVVEVVRCKDCNDYQTKFRWCKLHDGEMQPTDFCSYGEQRGGELNDSDQTAE